MARRTLACASSLLLLAACRGDGVDLRRGGTELVFALPQGFDANRADEALAQARGVAAARLAAAKLPAVVVVEGGRLRVWLPRSAVAEQVVEARTLVAVGGRLEYREVDDGTALKELVARLPEGSGLAINRDTWTDSAGRARGTFVLEAESAEQVRGALGWPPGLPPGLELLAEKDSGRGIRYYAVKAPGLDNSAIQEAGAPLDPYLPPEVSLVMTPEGAKRFEELTRRAVGKKVAAALDGEIVETTAVMTPATSGRATLVQGGPGDRKQRQRQAELLAAALRAGAMPALLRFEEERPLSPRR